MFRQFFVVLLLVACAGARGEDPATAEEAAKDFYVTAIFGSPSMGFVAVIEYPDGSLGRVRAGDRLDEARVEEIAPRWILLRDQGAEATRKVWLHGADKQAAKTPMPAGSGMAGEGSGETAGDVSPTGAPGAGGQPPTASATPTGADAAADERGAPKPLPGDKSLGELADQIRTLDRKALRKGSLDDLGGVLGPMLGLPPDSRIVEVNDAAPGSLEQGVSRVLRTVRQNKILRLNVDNGGDELNRVMVMPGSGRDDPARVITFGLGPQPQAAEPGSGE